MVKIFNIKFVFHLLMLFWTGVAVASTTAVIEVEAGNPISLCYGQTLDMVDLNASISGDVDDGIWFTNGDGIFLPSGISNGIFSETLQYQPGPSDLANGFFELILVSDDPDGNGPMVEVSDAVTISFMSAPALVCNSIINVSLAEGCSEEVTIDMLLANPQEPASMYTIDLIGEDGIPLEGLLLTVDELNTEVEFTVGHECTSNFCDGIIRVSDKIAPFLNCTDKVIDCASGGDPQLIGLPIPFYAQDTLIGQDSFLIFDLDACGDVLLTFDDLYEELSCSTGYIGSVTRTWRASDLSGNLTFCQEELDILPLPIDSVVLPPNWDDIDSMSLACGGDWPALDNGYPSPDTTGFPGSFMCSNIEATFSDIYFPLCGNGFKIARKWFVIDWCTATDLEFNQIIKVADHEPPSFSCPNDLTIEVRPYVCESEPFQLTPPDSVVDCSSNAFRYKIYTLDSVDITHLHIQGDVLSGLSLGQYLLEYIAIDDCGNQASCYAQLSVEDLSQPFAVCDEFTVTSVNTNGIAHVLAASFDDGSFDNCMLESMEVAKMTDACGHGLEYGPYVQFCCEEVGDTMMVAFRVTDAAGWTNVCMVEVWVDDKLPPEITCPSDLTIGCTVDIDLQNLAPFGTVVEGEENTVPIVLNGQVIGQGGFFEDNCSAIITTDHTSNVDCGTGEILRTFTATDAGQLSSTCTQRITVVNNNPFTLQDINWPSNFESMGCDTLDAAPEITGEPTWNTERCAQVASTYEDQVFYLADGSCLKILRTWTVIDWCTFDSQTLEGRWSYIQEIKLRNTVDPEILNCTDLTFDNVNPDCLADTVRITLDALDDCTSTADLQISWTLDENFDGIPEQFGNGSTFERLLENGSYQLSWSVEDRCGNKTSCDQVIEIRDGKNPTPYCLSSIGTAIMPSTGEIDIWASDFNLGSFDNCTPEEDLMFSFSPSINDQSRIITCEDIENGVSETITLELWVTDLAGNQDRCMVSFVVQDNDDVCPNNFEEGSIEGRLTTPYGKSVTDAAIHVTASIPEYSKTRLTDDFGAFTFENMPTDISYRLEVDHETGHHEGISTLDLVKIQKHILGLDRFDNPYAILASDVSGNGKVSASDLLVMRKMILGIITHWPNTQSDWRFIDADYNFPDVEDPFIFPDSIRLENIDAGIAYVDFLGVKMGDVNGSYQGFKNEINPESRSTDEKELLLTEFQKNGVYHYELQFPIERSIGFQLQVNGIQSNTHIETNLSSNEYHQYDQSWRLTYVHEEDKKPYVSFISPSPLELTLDDVFSAEWYDEHENIAHFKLTKVINASDVHFQPLINPFTTSLILNQEKACDTYDLQIFNTEGRLVYKSNGVCQNEIQIDESYFDSSGVFFVRIVSDGAVYTHRVVHL